MSALTALPVSLRGRLAGLRARVPRGRGREVSDEDERAMTALIASLAALVDAGMEPGEALGRLAASAGTPVSDRPETEAFLETASRAAAAERLGESPAGVLRAGAARARSPRTARVYAELFLCLRLSEEHGIALSRLLRVLAEVCRERLDAEADVRAALAGPESTAQLLLWLPAVGAGLGLLLMGSEWLGALASPAGLGLALLGALLTALGRRWTARILTRARRVSVE